MLLTILFSLSVRKNPWQRNMTLTMTEFIKFYETVPVTQNQNNLLFVYTEWSRHSPMIRIPLHSRGSVFTSHFNGLSHSLSQGKYDIIE